MEVTKWLKPSECGSRIGDRASVRAARRMNAEQASKRTMCGQTRQPFRGRLIRLGEMSEEYAQPLHQGSDVGAMSAETVFSRDGRELHTRARTRWKTAERCWRSTKSEG